MPTTDWTDEVTVNCEPHPYQNTICDWAVLKSMYIGNEEYEKDKRIQRAEKLAIIKIMQGCCCSCCCNNNQN